jgi:hypothetical protein
MAVHEGHSRRCTVVVMRCMCTTGTVIRLMGPSVIWCIPCAAVVIRCSGIVDSMAQWFFERLGGEGAPSGLATVRFFDTRVPGYQHAGQVVICGVTVQSTSFASSSCLVASHLRDATSSLRGIAFGKRQVRPVTNF